MSTLPLDDFTSGSYFKTLTPPKTIDYNFQPLLPSPPLPPGKLGRWRQTVFQNGGNNRWHQPCTLDIRTPLNLLSGILIVNAGFDAVGSVIVLYGNTPLLGNISPGSQNLQGPPAPLGLNLSLFSEFQLVFAGLANSEGCNVIIGLSSPAGGALGPNWSFEIAQVVPNDNSFTLHFPFSRFSNAPPPNGTVGLPHSVISDIASINFVVEPTPSSSFGITSFQAVG